MKPTFFGLITHKLQPFKAYFRMMYFKMRGLQIKNGSVIGKISCDWPNSLIIGENCELQDNIDFRIWHPYDEESYIKFGNRVFIGHNCEFVSSTRIIIGNNCLIASSTTFNDTGHEYSKSSLINTQPCTTNEINIEDDVWIGTSCSILQGVTIGKGSVIGAGSVVNKSIPEYQVWAGVPARFIKNRN